jgi:transcriptional regulator with XRE-family HTH domain
MQSRAQLQKLFARRLRISIRMSGKTQREICKELHITTATMQYWLTGTKSPNSIVIYQLCKLIGVDFSSMFSEEFDPKKTKTRQDVLQTMKKCIRAIESL